MRHTKDTLTQDESDAINALADLASPPNQHKLVEGKERPPLRLQNLALPARVAACRVVLSMANGTPYMAALQEQGLTHLQFEVIRHKDHDFALVVEAAKRVRDALTVAKAAQGLDRLLTDDECGLNVKAIMFAAERLDPERFGHKADGASGGGSGPKVVYNIVIPAVSGVQSCGNLAATPQTTPIIEVNANENA